MIRNYEKKPCTCWMKIKSCYCTTAYRYTVRDKTGEPQSIYDDLNEAVKDGREHLDEFDITDANNKNKKVIDYGEE